jgi:hypothetical protein
VVERVAITTSNSTSLKAFLPMVSSVTSSITVRSAG